MALSFYDYPILTLLSFETHCEFSQCVSNESKTKPIKTALFKQKHIY